MKQQAPRPAGAATARRTRWPGASEGLRGRRRCPGDAGPPAGVARRCRTALRRGSRRPRPRAGGSPASRRRGVSPGGASEVAGDVVGGGASHGGRVSGGVVSSDGVSSSRSWSTSKQCILDDPDGLGGLARRVAGQADAGAEPGPGSSALGDRERVAEGAAVGRSRLRRAEGFGEGVVVEPDAGRRRAQAVPCRRVPPGDEADGLAGVGQPGRRVRRVDELARRRRRERLLAVGEGVGSGRADEGRDGERNDGNEDGKGHQGESGGIAHELCFRGEGCFPAPFART